MRAAVLLLTLATAHADALSWGDAAPVVAPRICGAECVHRTGCEGSPPSQCMRGAPWRDAQHPNALTRLRGGSGSVSLSGVSPMTRHPDALTRLRGGSGSISLSGASPMVRTCAFFASLDALLLGYDIGVVSGILVFIQDRFHLSLIETGNFAAALNAAAIVGALVSGWVADRFGRKPALFISSLMFTSGSFLMAGANSYRALLLGRYVQGYGVGAGLLISPMFISEIAPPAFRGSLVTLSEVSLSLGVLLAYIANYALASLDHQWRWMLALGAVPGILLCLRILFLPESPRFLVGQGRRAEAQKVLRRMMDNQPAAVADRTLAEITASAEIERGSSWALLRQPATLAAVGVGLVLAVLQHAVGIESIIYHSPILFQQAGIVAKRSAILGTVGMGVVKLVFETCASPAHPAASAMPLPLCPPPHLTRAQPGRTRTLHQHASPFSITLATSTLASPPTRSYALLNVDTIGRRPLLLIGAGGLTVVLTVLGAALRYKVTGVAAGALAPGVTPTTYLIFGCVMLYSAFHAISFG